MSEFYLREARESSANRFQKLQAELEPVEALIAEEACVYATGSFGRMEAGPHSDLDLFIVVRSTMEATDEGQKEVRALSGIKEIKLKYYLVDAVENQKIEDFDGDGKYLKVHTIREFTANLGSPHDDSKNTFTGRLLMLLEGRPLLGREVYGDALQQVVEAYFRDFEGNEHEFIPAFLFNDIIRMWRTFCVNYEFYRKKGTPKSKVKLFKLKYIRMLTCYSALVYMRGKSVLLEGTQGSGLSIFHGPYPYVTSRDTNVAGCLAEAGISPSRVRRILMVVRSTPIRVANPTTGRKNSRVQRVLKALGLPAPAQRGALTSGPLKHETSFAEIAAAAGLDATKLRHNEKTSTTKRDRRVGWFEWDRFRDACSINAPTDIVLTFADYIAHENMGARRFELLTPGTILFVEELERVSCAPVSLIVTRFPRTDEERLDRRSILDRRDWQTTRAKQTHGAIGPFATEGHIEAEFETLRARVGRMRAFFKTPRR